MTCFQPGVHSQKFTNAPAGLTVGGDPGCPAAIDGVLDVRPQRVADGDEAGEDEVVFELIVAGVQGVFGGGHG